MDLLIGADVGGTTSKVIACGLDGAVRAFGSAAGGNIRSSGSSALDNVFEAMAQALEAAGGGHVIAAHLGIAGAGAARYDEIRALCLGGAARLGIDPAVLGVTTDLETAFAASSSDGQGLLLLSGTGAVAAAFSGHRIVGRCDGMGWLLGDEGSGTWIGLRALQSAARSVDHRGSPTSLAGPVLRAIADHDGPAPGTGTPPGDPRQQMIADAYRLPPAALGSLAPLVFEHARGGDPVSRGILADAARALVRTAEGAVLDAYGTDIPPAGATVLAGGLLGVGGPLHDRVSSLLARELPMVPVIPDGSVAPPVVGAVRMAARAAGVPVDLAALRQQVLESTPFS